ncbi:hypothetical protein GQ43DRAFT_362224 [Delitschia confertaspora ATCC 74209]|uniref:Rhodopsin domain-containing protein n=1 Tax=Delitschia confertaspora ATCC 74209 TaxID=1513339 RepID=A0A9P4JW82_9PLEO|nr:hypothetical protein GQ43DRAFT_362224 [Delitschia confertaspora ATCC 74209]
MPPWNTGIATVLERQAPPGPPVYPPEFLEFNNKNQILAITGTLFALALFVVLVRCYVRLAMLKVFGADDWIMVFAMILTTGTFACFVAETHYGLGRHFMAMVMEPANYAKFAEILYVHSIIVMVAVSAVKISIALFLLRLSTRTPYSRFLYGIIGMAVFIVCLTIACSMTLIFQCFPVQAAWDYRLRPPPVGTGTAKCYNMTIFRNLGLMNSSFNIITDFLFATIPIPLVWKLQLNVRTKVSLIAVLSLGYFASAAAIVKAIQQWHALEEPDWTVNDSFNLWNFIELTIGIIAACLPALKPLFNWFLETARAFTTGQGRTTGYNKNGYKNGASLGYQKHSDRSSKSIGMNSLTNKSMDSPKHPYNVRVIATEDKDWDMDRAKTSDESIIPLQQRPSPGQNGIVLTREIRVT